MALKLKNEECRKKALAGTNEITANPSYVIQSGGFVIWDFRLVCMRRIVYSGLRIVFRQVLLLPGGICELCGAFRPASKPADPFGRRFR